MSEVEKQGDTITMKPGIDIVASSVEEFQEQALELLKESPKEFVLDFTGVNMIDSMGIGIVIAIHNSLNKSGGKLKIIKIPPQIFNVFTAMRLGRHFVVEAE